MLRAVNWFRLTEIALYVAKRGSMFYRSQLFVPGNRPDRFDKACQAGADLVCIDLEDSVGVADKDSARETVLAWLAQTEHKHVSLRINGTDTAEGQADIQALKSSGLNLPFLMLPKVASRDEVEGLARELPENLGPFFTIIESAIGMVNVDDIFACDRVKLGMYGAIDYAGDVDCDLAWETHLYGRCKLVAAAGAYDVLLFDVPHVDVRNLDDCEASTRKAKALGIHARSAIHPAQVARIHAALAPSSDEVAYAERVLEAYEAANGNVVLMDGKFVEAPVVKRAERILAFRNRNQG